METKEREKIKLTVKELQDIVYEDSDQFELIKNEIHETWRHGTEHIAIIQRYFDGKFFELNYRDSVKDECEFQDMNYDREYHEVFPVEEKVIVYK